MGKSIFSILLSLNVVVAFIICSKLLFYIVDAEYKLLILKSFIVIISIGWYTFSIKDEDNIGVFFLNILALGVFSSPIMLMILVNSKYAFFISLILVIFNTIFFYTKEYENAWDLVLSSAYITWIITCAIVVLGSSEYSPFSFSKFVISKPSVLYDVRFIISAISLSVFLINSFMKSINDGRPMIDPLPGIPLFNIEESRNSIASQFMNSIFVVFNTLLISIMRVTEVIWQLVASFGVFIGRIGKYIADSIVYLVTEIEIWKCIINSLIIFICVILYSLFLEYVDSYIYYYVINSLNTFSYQSVSHLLLVSLFFLFNFLAIIIMKNSEWEFDIELIHRDVFGGCMILMSIALSGGIMYLLSRIKFLEISGFDSIGLYTFIVLVIVIGVLLFQISKRIQSYN